MNVFLAAQMEMEVCFSGPMRSGIVLDSQSLLDAGYRNFQQQLAEKLHELYLGDWECPGQNPQGAAAFRPESFQSETALPPYVISRSFTGHDLKEILEEFHLPREIRARHETKPEEEEPVAKALPLVFMLDRLDIFLYDFGYAACMIHGRATALKDLSGEDCRTAIEAIGAALPDYAELSQSTLAKIAKVIPPQLMRLNMHGEMPATKPDWEGTALRRHVGELFWAHRIFCFPCGNKAEFTRIRDESRACLYSDRALAIEDRSMRPDMAVYPGYGNSGVAYVKYTVQEGEAARLSDAIRAMNVFYAALQDADRDHFHINNETAGRLDTADTKTIERQMLHMAQVLARTGFIKSVFDDYDNQLDPPSSAIWDHLRKAWLLADLFQALDQKIAMTEKTYDRLARRLADLRSRKTGELLVFFLALMCLAGILPSLKGPGQALAAAIVLAFALGAATLMAVRYYKTK